MTLPRRDPSVLPRPGREAGFTLVEMLVVLIILGLVGAVVLTRGPSRSATLDMRTASATVAAALRQARSRAISLNSPTLVRFDAARAVVQVGADAVRVLPSGIGMAIVTAEEQGSAVRFLPDGSSTGGHIDLAGHGRAAQVTVDWLTGRVVVAPRP